MTPLRLLCKGLTESERADLARLLFKAGHTIRPGKIRLTKSGPLIPCIELLDIKNAAPGGNDTEDGKAEKNPPSL